MANDKITSIVALKRAIARRMGRLAARKYTHVWNRVIREAQGLHPKSNKTPPNFKGNRNKKYNQALLYKNRIAKYARMFPRKIENTLYRGMTKENVNWFSNKNKVVNVPVLKSFTKNLRKAYEYAGTAALGRKTQLSIMRIKTNKKIPVVNFTNGKVISEFGPGGKRYAGVSEQEVLFPPGYYIVNNISNQELFKDPWGRGAKVKIYNVTYKHMK